MLTIVKAQRERLVLLEQRVHKEQQELPAHKVQRVQWEQLALQEQPV